MELYRQPNGEVASAPRGRDRPRVDARAGSRSSSRRARPGHRGCPCGRDRRARLVSLISTTSDGLVWGGEPVMAEPGTTARSGCGLGLIVRASGPSANPTRRRRPAAMPPGRRRAAKWRLPSGARRRSSGPRGAGRDLPGERSQLRRSCSMRTAASRRPYVGPWGEPWPVAWVNVSGQRRVETRSAGRARARRACRGRRAPHAFTAEGSAPATPDSPAPFTRAGLVVQGPRGGPPPQRRQVVGARPRVVHEGRGEELAVLVRGHESTCSPSTWPSPWAMPPVDLPLHDRSGPRCAPTSSDRGVADHRPARPVSGSISTFRSRGSRWGSSS